MPGHDIICIGASAGGVEVLVELVKHLPRDLPAAVLIVVHVAPNSSSVLPSVLNRAGNLPAAHATPDEPLRRGRIYVARPDFHLLLRNGGNGRIILGRGPKENSARPAIDPLFRSAARAYGRRVVGVVLSGSLDDGTVGLDVIKHMGGVTIVQDPETALFPSMPRSAMENVDVDHVLPPDQLPELLVRLSRAPVTVATEAESEAAMPDEIRQEADMAELDEGSIKEYERPGKPSGFTCPECHGSLFELSEGQLIRFRCRTGHAFSAESLMAEQGDNLEAAMWTALTALKERAALATRLADRAGQRGHEITERQFRQQAGDAERQAELIREALLATTGGTEGGPIPSEGFTDEHPETVQWTEQAAQQQHQKADSREPGARQSREAPAMRPSGGGKSPEP